MRDGDGRTTAACPRAISEPRRMREIASGVALKPRDDRGVAELQVESRTDGRQRIGVEGTLRIDIAMVRASAPRRSVCDLCAAAWLGSSDTGCS
jgi:hypothetical protein